MTGQRRAAAPIAASPGAAPRSQTRQASSRLGLKLKPAPLVPSGRCDLPKWEGVLAPALAASAEAIDLLAKHALAHSVSIQGEPGRKAVRREADAPAHQGPE